ncbi:MAG: glycerol-3-phosphate dehydrogenase [Clostridiales bacterium]|nr:glycerol-3-phosphate dehydrogenase [Clostridiales bacterium]
MKITVIGCGRWGSFIAYYLSDVAGHDVTLYGRKSSRSMGEFISSRKNKYLMLPEKIRLTTELSEALDTDTVVISVNSQGLRSLFSEINAVSDVPRRYILCMKGIEIDTGCRLSEIVGECAKEGSRVAVWLGPGHVEEFLRGTPNCMVIDSDDGDLKSELVEEFSSQLIRFYYGTDLLGNEIGAASKNVIGIAAGMLDGHGLTALKGALMARGTREISRLIGKMGGDPNSAYGLCHLGDYEATVFSKFSHNRAFGEAWVKGEEYGELAEGYYTVRALTQLGCKYGEELPICSAVEDILYKHRDSSECLSALFARSLKSEF